MVVEKIKADIDASLKNLDLAAFENMYEIKDTFKLLVRFHANLEIYCNSQFSAEIDKNLENKIKALEISVEMEKILLELNEIRDRAIHSDYELSKNDETKVNRAVVGSII